LALVVWALSGIYIIDEGERGVVLQFGAYKKTTTPGPHWHPRFIQTVERVNVTGIRSVDLGTRTEDALMLTQDENIVDVKFTVQYNIKDARNYLFNARHPDETLRQAAESAVREVVGKNKMDFIITGGRADVVARGEELLQEVIDTYEIGIELTSLNMQEAWAPKQVQAAFDDAVKAREDEQRLINEAEAYANDILPKARGQAARMLEEANAYKATVIAEAEGESARFTSILAEYQQAPSITRKRLYLDAMESVFTQSSKVIIDAEGSGNMLYLPIDKLVGRSSGSSGGQSTGEVKRPPYQRSGAGSEPRESTRLRDDLRRREVR